MQITVTVQNAIAQFESAKSYYKNAEYIWQKEEELAIHREANQIASLPWYKRLFAEENWFTGFEEAVKAENARKAKKYCEQQLRVLSTLASMSRVTLSQRDLSILEQTND